MRNLFNGFMLACLLSLNAGCILGPIAGSQLTSDQMQALKSYNDNGDVYLCALLGGPPPTGNVVVIAVPKDAPVNVQFGPDCHATVVSGVPPSGIMTPRN